VGSEMLARPGSWWFRQGLFALGFVVLALYCLSWSRGTIPGNLLLVPLIPIYIWGLASGVWLLRNYPIRGSAPRWLLVGGHFAVTLMIALSVAVLATTTRG
jgi:hypothetical protein